MTSLAYVNTRYEEDDGEFKSILDAVNTVNDLTGNGLLADFSPSLRYFPTPAAVKIKKVITMIEEIFQRKWDEHVETYDPSAFCSNF